MTSRREFLATAGLLPLIGRWPVSLTTNWEREAKRLHKRVLAAFDVGATLRPRPYTTTFIHFSEYVRDVDVLLANLQHAVAELKRGREYRVVTRVIELKNEVTFTATVQPLDFVYLTRPFAQVWAHSDRRRLV